MNKDEVWQEVLQSLKKYYQPTIISIYFNNQTSIYSITDDVVTIEVPIKLVKDKLLQNEYYDNLNNIFTEITGKNRKIEIKLSEELNTVNNNNIINNNENNDVFEENYEYFDSNLNKNLTFDNFIEGDTNRFARSTAMKIAQNPNGMFNPLFIWGKSGIGKTHLLSAIGNYIVEHQPNIKVLYITSGEFKQDYVNSANNKNTIDAFDKFNKKYRGADVLIIDDIQFLVDPEKSKAGMSKEEFFHLFDYLLQHNKQVVISSDKSPDDYKNLEARLTTRFSMGLPVDIYPPDFNLRVNIIKDKIRYLDAIKAKLDDDAIDYIANNFNSDVRTIEGAINRLVAYAGLFPDRKMDLSLTIEALGDSINKNIYKENDIGSIQKVVAAYYDITVDVLKGKSRKKDVAYARMLAMYLCRNLTDKPLEEIGLDFGGRDHSTVIHANRTIEEDLRSNTQLKEIIDDIKKKL